MPSSRIKSTFVSSEMPLFILVLLAGLAIGFVITQRTQQQQQQPTRIVSAAPSPPIEISVVSQGGDDRYTRAPRPQRFWDNGPELPPRGALIPMDGGRLINIPTQGLPESYQSMGVLKTEDGQVLPLYGRRVASRSDRFNYYTRTDTYNPVPLPVSYKRRDCQDSMGCEELYNGDEVKLSPTGATATATLYQFDGPTYIPSIL
jgi:hypothetical protein